MLHHDICILGAGPGGAIAALVGAAALPSLARPSVTAAAFDRIDANHDGLISRGEYRLR